MLVCRKCSRRRGGGFGPDSTLPLAKALRRHCKLKKGRKASAGIVEVGCLGVCPKHAVVAVDAAHPTRWLLVRPGADLDIVARELGLVGQAEA